MYNLQSKEDPRIHTGARVLVQDREQLLEIVRDVVTEPTHFQSEIDLADLPKLIDVTDDKGLYVYRFRHHIFDLNLHGIVGNLELEQARGFVRASIVHKRAELNGRTSGGDWWVCAWEVKSATRRQRDRAPNPRANQPYSTFSGEPSPNRTQQIWKQVPYLEVALAWIDVSMSQEADRKTVEQGERANTPIGSYLRTARLPSFLRVDRDKAADLMRRYSEYHGATEESGLPEPRELTDDEVSMALSMQLDHGATYKQIGAALGVPWQTVAAAVRRAQAAEPLEESPDDVV